MTVEGIWALTIATPIGKQHVTVELVRQDNVLHGVARGGNEEVPLIDVAFDGTRLTWAQSITRPMRLNLVFDVTVHGDEMTGYSKAGRLPRSTVTGGRIDTTQP